MVKPVPVPREVAERMAMEKLAAQYRGLFGIEPGPGEPDTRSEAQIAVWTDLKKAGYFELPTWIPDRQEQVCPYRAAQTEGRRALFLYVRANVNFVPGTAQQPQQK